MFNVPLHTLSQMIRDLKLIVGCLAGLAIHLRPDLILLLKDILKARLSSSAKMREVVHRLKNTRLPYCSLLVRFLDAMAILFILIHLILFIILTRVKLIRVDDQSSFFVISICFLGLLPTP